MISGFNRGYNENNKIAITIAITIDVTAVIYIYFCGSTFY